MTRSLADPAACAAEAARWASDLRELGTAERAVSEKAYLKSDLEFAGTGVPAIRTMVRAWLKARADLTHDADLARLRHGADSARLRHGADSARLRHGADSARLRHDELVCLVEALWASPLYESRQAAVILLEGTGPLLGPADMPLLERLLRTSHTWALVDGLAVTVAGGLVERHRELGDVLDRWAADDDFWLRRSALLALLRPLRAGGGDFDRFSRYADAMLTEQEFFIRKAIGWVLREVARRRPELVASWLGPRVHLASGVTVRAAVKPLPGPIRAALLAGYRDKIPIRWEHEDTQPTNG